ncbi:hypothetical protein C8Q76DRAFT_798867 [Earliella scabrosa]|nr:hypothetical protein C8Q76DRAFT_798867 [Earliella scabrosa]
MEGGLQATRLAEPAPYQLKRHLHSQPSLVLASARLLAGSANAMTTHLEERGTACLSLFTDCLHACGSTNCNGSGDCSQYCKCAYCWNTNPDIPFPCVSNTKCLPPNF